MRQMPLIELILPHDLKMVTAILELLFLLERMRAVSLRSSGQ